MNFDWKKAFKTRWIKLLIALMWFVAGVFAFVFYHGAVWHIIGAIDLGLGIIWIWHFCASAK